MTFERGELARFLQALQPARVAPGLNALLGGAPGPVHVLDAKYEPGARGVLLYRRGTELVVGTLLPTGRTAGLGCAVSPGVQLWRFPLDPELPMLPSVLDPRVLGEALTEALGGPADSAPARAARCRTSLLRFRPGRRATLLTALAGGGTRYVVKAYHDADKAAAVAIEGPRLALAATGSHVVALAPTVAHLPALRVVVQLAVGGTPLDALLGGTAHATATAALDVAGRALAGFHQLAGVTDRLRSVTGELRRFHVRASAISEVRPRVGDVLMELADRLLTLHSQLPAVVPGLVHGDCKPGQFLVAGRRAYLIDLDHVGLADQAGDVGTFLASLRQWDIRRSLRRPPAVQSAAVEVLSRSFLTAYRDAHGGALDPARVVWQTAAALERKALRAFARAPVSPLPLALAAEAHRCLDGMETSRW